MVGRAGAPESGAVAPAVKVVNMDNGVSIAASSGAKFSSAQRLDATRGRLTLGELL